MNIRKGMKKGMRRKLGMMLAAFVLCAAIPGGHRQVHAEEAAGDSAPAPSTKTAAQNAAASPAERLAEDVALPEGADDELFVSERLSFDEIAAMLPAALAVTYSDGTEQETEVSWQPLTDPDEDKSYYYIFDPVLPDSCRIADTVSLPYIVVWYVPGEASGQSAEAAPSQMMKQKPMLYAGGAEDEAFAFFCGEMGLNQAAAAGIMANIKAESNFDPTAEGDQGTSYGLCQWHNARWEDLKSFCEENGEDWTTAAGQLKFLKKELEKNYPGVYTYLKKVSNDAEGAYNAAAYFCEKFERPANAAQKAEARGRVARDTYWPKYKDVVVGGKDGGEKTDALHLVWKLEDGKYYWYENGTRQGTADDPKGVRGDETVRGREIYDPASDAWYWLDSVYDGAKAAGKEVWIPYIYQDEADWDEAKRKEAAAGSGPMAEQVQTAMSRHGSADAGKWVRYDADGRMIKGWYTVTGKEAERYPGQEGNRYYYDPRTGLMAKGRVIIDGATYVFDETTGVLREEIRPKAEADEEDEDQSGDEDSSEDED